MPPPFDHRNARTGDCIANHYLFSQRPARGIVLSEAQTIKPRHTTASNKFIQTEATTQGKMTGVRVEID
jgi:hypothetical protein